MAGGGNSFYEHSSGHRPSVSSAGDPPNLDGSFLLQLLQRKPHGTAVTSSSSQPLRPYQESTDTGFSLLPHNLLSHPKLLPASNQPGLHFGESPSHSPPSWAPHHFSPPDGGSRHLPRGMDHKRSGFAQTPNSAPLNSNLGWISHGTPHDVGLSSNQVGNSGGKVSGHRDQNSRASMRPPPGFGKAVSDAPAECNRKVEGSAHSQIVYNGSNQQWRSHSRPEWRPSHYEEGNNSTFKAIDKSNLHTYRVEGHNVKHNSGKFLDSDAQHRRPNGFTNYKEKHTYSDFSGIPILNKCDFTGEKVGGEFDRNLEDNDVDKQINRDLEEVLGVEIGEVSSKNVTCIDEAFLCKQLTSVLRESLESNTVTKLINSRDKDVRSDSSRGHQVSSQRVRIRRRELRCRYNIDNFSSRFLHIFQSLVPSEDEIAKQEQLLFSLKKLVNKEWPDAELHLYGSCANSFGVSNSDIDICLAIKDYEKSKLDILLKLADILESSDLQNVQALTRARVPIVKMKDPVTGISCDICVNNLLAVVNTKLLKDYAQIDKRLRQLAFIVKHWAKSRRVNETYQGTLSSYAYVLMCIYFLQTREPAILPCLQGMAVTCKVIVDDTECAYFDQVEKLRNFGAQNKESIAHLLWAFFHYWAYRHDYTNDVISVRTGSIISKQAKDWTRRIGNDRHLICIEDPFEVSHDLGRVVDKFTIKILREEFERAADILQYDPNPTAALFEPYNSPGSST